MATDDRLSALPDGILLDIVSRLCTDELVRTSVLSTRWRCLWTASPVLHFFRSFSPRVSPKLEDYPNIVDRCLRQCSASHRLRSVHFPTDHGFTAVVDRWIRFAASGGVEELALSPLFFGGPRFEVPPSLFDCRRLSTLRLHGPSISSAPSASSGFHGFPCLRTLALIYVFITDGPLDALLWACPRIEHLTLSYVHGFASLVIRAPAMRHLIVSDCSGLRRVEIAHAPELRRFMYCGDLSIIRSLEGVAPKLEEAALLSFARCAVDSRRQRDLVSSIAHVRVLSVNSWFFEKFKHGQGFGFGDGQPKFVNLQELHWWPVFKKCAGLPWRMERLSDSFNGLISFLRECPSLEQLCILRTYDLEDEDDFFCVHIINIGGGSHAFDDDDDDEEDHDDEDEDHDPLQKFEGAGFVLPRLKTVRMVQFSGYKEEMRLLGFLAEKAVALETMNLHYVAELCTKQRLKKIRQELRAFHRVSPVARILISQFDVDKVWPKHEHMWMWFKLMWISGSKLVGPKAFPL